MPAPAQPTMPTNAEWTAAAHEARRALQAGQGPAAVAALEVVVAGADALFPEFDNAAFAEGLAFARKGDLRRARLACGVPTPADARRVA